MAQSANLIKQAKNTSSQNRLININFLNTLSLFHYYPNYTPYLPIIVL